MRHITFMVTEDEVVEVAESMGVRSLSHDEIVSILNMVEGDEMLATDIRNSIIGSIQDQLGGGGLDCVKLK